LSDVDPTYLRRSVYYPTGEPPGTIVIDPQAHFLYLVEGGGRAIRYGVGVGRSGFEWSGNATIHNKQEWPDWYPPKEMIERQPEIRRMMSELQSGIGMHGGPRNPLGARALSHSRHRRTLDDRQECLVRMHPHDQSGCDRPLSAHAHRRQGRGAFLARVRCTNLFSSGSFVCNIAISRSWNRGAVVS
jgi:hypothetical protein